MNQIEIFYSWQSDSPRRVNRNFIKDALDDALERVKDEYKLDFVAVEAGRDEIGSPEIADMVEAKIRRAVLFVADLTIVARRKNGQGVINSCVSFEWGYAAASLGNGALIGVMNRTYGEPAQLPSDIRQHLIGGAYRLSEGRPRVKQEEVRRSLSEDLKKAIIAAVQARFFRRFSSGSVPIVEHLVRESTTGLASSDRISVSDLAKEARTSEPVAQAVMRDLVNLGMATDSGGAGSSICSAIRLTEPCFVYFDPLFMGWNADQDAVQLAKLLTERGDLQAEDLQREFRWCDRQLNPAIWRLLQGGFADRGRNNSNRYFAAYLSPNAATEGLALGRVSLPPIAPRALFQP